MRVVGQLKKKKVAKKQKVGARGSRITGSYFSNSMSGGRKKRRVSCNTDSSARLAMLIQERIKTNNELERLEKQIFELEGSYLTNTGPEGNIVEGWGRPEHLTKTVGDGSKNLQRENRIFSLSSKSAPFEK